MRKTVKQRKRALCEFCKKDIKKNLSYYRDGKYYCNHNHYVRLKKKIKKENKK